MNSREKEFKSRIIIPLSVVKQKNLPENGEAVV
jgi:hypothetical protein